MGLRLDLGEPSGHSSSFALSRVDGEEEALRRQPQERRAQTLRETHRIQASRPSTDPRAQGPTRTGDAPLSLAVAPTSGSLWQTGFRKGQRRSLGMLHELQQCQL